MHDEKALPKDTETKSEPGFGWVGHSSREHSSSVSGMCVGDTEVVGYLIEMSSFYSSG